jgi:hypothetical protein
VSPFTRTSSGLQNQHLFHRVDYVVFTEGEHGASDSVDGLFWARVFSNWLPGKSVRVKLVGGKPVARKIAREVIKRDLKSTLVALDRDYDRWEGCGINDARIIYTWGYSVENDLLCEHSIVGVVATVLRQPSAPPALAAAVNKELTAVDQALNRLIALDYAYYRSKYALLDREKPGKTIKPAPRASAPPGINRPGVLNQLDAARLKVPHRWHGPIPARTSSQDLVGKIWAYFCYHLVAALLKGHAPSLSVTKDHFLDIALERWRNFSVDFPNHVITQHYSAALALIP